VSGCWRPRPSATAAALAAAFLNGAFLNGAFGLCLGCQLYVLIRRICTLATVYLLREAAGRQLPLRVVLIDRHGRHGLGQAYSTAHPAHLLNSPASRMSAVAGDPDHLIRWAAGAGLPRDGFLPRSAYGRYLTELLAAAERSAQPAALVYHLTAQVAAIRRGSHGRALRLHLAEDGRIDADAAVLATGNLPPAPARSGPGTVVTI
jgi:uncharacterized NAD(P)/FAD-binding protein YdhS